MEFVSLEKLYCKEMAPTKEKSVSGLFFKGRILEAYFPVDADGPAEASTPGAGLACRKPQVALL